MVGSLPVLLLPFFLDFVFSGDAGVSSVSVCVSKAAGSNLSATNMSPLYDKELSGGGDCNDKMVS